MATLEQLSAALVKADAAGNTDDARAFAAEIRKLKNAPEAQTTIAQDLKQGAGNLAAGLVRGAGSIGATILYPVDKITDMVKGDRNNDGLNALVLKSELGSAYKPKLSRNEERRAQMDAGLKTAGANPESLAFGAGKLGAEIAGTAAIGGVLAKPVQALAATRFGSGIEPIINGLATSLKSGGFRTGEMAGAGVGNALTRIVGGAATGGAAAGLVDPSTAGTGAIIGGALPGVTQLAGKAGSAIRNAVGSKVAPEVQALASRAKELGIDIPADRLLDSKPLNAVASGLNYVPFSGRAATEARMEGQLDRAITRTFGQDSSNVTQALRKAGDDLGSKFDSVLKKNTVNFDKQFVDELHTVADTAQKELGSDALRPIVNQIDEIFAKGGNGAIDGQAAYNIKRTLDRLGKGQGPEAYHALELKRALMGALDRSLGAEEAAAFAQTRQQYGNMLALQKLATNGAEGGISAARLGNMKNINNKELQELADIAAQFVKAREGQHGAAQRAAVGVATFGMSGAPGLAAGAGIGRGANAALNSNAVKNYLMRAPVSNEAEPVNALIRGAARTAPLLSSQ